MVGIFKCFFNKWFTLLLTHPEVKGQRATRIREDVATSSDSFYEHARQNLLRNKKIPTGAFPNEENNLKGKDQSASDLLSFQLLFQPSSFSRANGETNAPVKHSRNHPYLITPTFINIRLPLMKKVLHLFTPNGNSAFDDLNNQRTSKPRLCKLGVAFA